MNKYKQRDRKIVDELINNSFPELKKEIRLVHLPFFWSFGTVLRGIKKDYVILFGKIQKKSKKASEGFLAHELCHLVDINEFSLFWAFIRYNLINDLTIFFKYNTLEEKADKRTIEKGYAKNLIANIKDVEKKYPKWLMNYMHSKGYMSPKEIKKYAIKIGKW